MSVIVDQTSLALILQCLDAITIVCLRRVARNWDRASREKLAWTHAPTRHTTYERFALIPHNNSIPHVRHVELPRGTRQCGTSVVRTE